MLHILSAVQIEFAGSRVGGKKIIEVIRENKLVHILSDGYLVYIYIYTYRERNGCVFGKVGVNSAICW